MEDVLGLVLGLVGLVGLVHHLRRVSFDIS